MSRLSIRSWGLLLTGTAVLALVLTPGFVSGQTPSSSSAGPGTSSNRAGKRSRKSKAANSNEAAPASASGAPAASSPKKARAAKSSALTAEASNCAANMVWVNTGSGVYHNSNSRYFGKTKQGKCMSEDDAKKAGYHPAKKGG